MQKILLWLIPGLFCTSLFAAENPTYIHGSPGRDELLKAAVNRDRGTISVLEPASAAGRGIYVGYSSGTVLNCYGSNRCKELSDTPSTPVQGIAVSRRGDTEVVWVSYRQGALYQCIDGVCSRFLWDREPGKE